MILGRLLLLASMLHLGSAILQARFFQRSRAPHRGSTIALRRRLHVNTLITEPGTMEVEWNHVYWLSGSYFMPSTIKYTPEGSHIAWGRTEFSASFDALSSSKQDDSRVTHFSDRMTFAADTVLFDGEKLDLAIVPQITFFLRDEDGARLGATGIARYDWGQNSAGMTLTWTGATVASAANPAGSFDVGAGYGRRLASSGFLGHWTAHGNFVYEKSTGIDRLLSVFEGVECQLSQRVALDLSGQHAGVSPGVVDHQIAVGLTVNLGQPRRWFH